MICTPLKHGGTRVTVEKPNLILSLCENLNLKYLNNMLLNFFIPQTLLKL